MPNSFTFVWEYATSTFTCSMERVERKHAGETAIAAKVELAAKAALVMMSMPVFASLLEIAGELLRL